jgi:glutamate-1-semialdehyde 2,1-aminomutase
MIREKSEQIFDQLCQVIPGGVNSPVRSCKSMGQLPLIVESAKGDLLFDPDGHSYIDFCGSWGALIHGHAHPVIVNAVRNRLEQGTSFGTTTKLEGVIGQEVVNKIDSIEKIRFVCSGTEATMSVARLARGFTKKDVIVKFSGNYHGHADFFLIKAGSGVLDASPSASSDGIPEEVVKHTVSIRYNDQAECAALFSHPDFRHRIAAVIIEPIAGNIGVVPAEQEFIHFLRKETEKIEALLIFDEVITGFRVHPLGAQKLYGVRPDLTCFGKIIGGGLPAAAFGGRREVMDCLAPLGAVYQAGTLSGNPLAMEAGLQSLRLLDRPGFYEELERKTALFAVPIHERIKEKGWNACLQRVGSMFTLFFGKKEIRNLDDALETDGKTYAQLFRTLFLQGIYIPPSQHESWFISDAHTIGHLNKARDAILKFMESTF